MKKAALYIHFPFCIKKCNYCDFASFPITEKLQDEYTNLLINEIDMYSKKMKDYEFETIFFGGGTPSLIKEKNIDKIMNELYKKFNLNLEEVTMEINPKTLNEDKIKVYKDLGINRASIGLQSFNDNLLRKIGRAHNTDDFLYTYDLVRKNGIENINVDVMFNLPDQTLQDVINTLNRLMKLQVKHISYYSLKIEPNTVFFDRHNNGDLILPDEDLEREMYHKGIKKLEKNNIYQYEISNFAVKGFECLHNLYYWKLKPYLGLGISSHSNMFNKRWSNTKSYSDYKEKLEIYEFPTEEYEMINKEMEISEYIILGLRLNEGILKKEFNKKFNLDIKNKYKETIEYFKKYGLLSETNEKLVLTNKGIDLSNLVFKEFLS